MRMSLTVVLADGLPAWRAGFFAAVTRGRAGARPQGPWMALQA